MADSIYSVEWWRRYLSGLRSEFAELTMNILLAGGESGAGGIGGISIDWEAYNQDALDWLDMYLGDKPLPGLTSEGAYPWAWAVNETTRRGVTDEITRWIKAGAPLPELELRLRGLFDDRRAHMIAVTEVTRIYASGNVMAWKASGVVDGKRWQTARDEMVCPICSKLHGSYVDLRGGWEFSAATLAANPELAKALRAPMTVIVPPAHVNCRCWLQPVVLAALSEDEAAAGLFDPMGGKP